MRRSLFQLPLFTFCWLLALALPSPAQQEAPAWKLVHGSTEQYGSLTIQRIGEVYLQGRAWSAVPADQIDLAAESGPMLVVGSLKDNAVAAALAQQRMSYRRGGWFYQGRMLQDGIGFVLGLHSATGQPVTVFTGWDDDGVLQGFTTTVDVTRPRDLVVQQGKLLYNWGWPVSPAPKAPPLVFDVATPALKALAGRASTHGRPPAAACAEAGVRALMGSADELALIDGLPGTPLRETIRQRLFSLMGHEQERGAAIRQLWLQDHDTVEETRFVWDLVIARFGHPRRSPAIHLLLAGVGATNARTVDAGPYSSRPRVLLNLACFADVHEFRVALAHELVHILQLDAEGHLPRDPMLIEGVAVAMSAVLIQGTSPAQAMMWTEGQWSLAQATEAAAARDFAHARAEAEDLSSWFVLGQRPLVAGQVSDYPDRMGYYLGYQAALAWRAAHPDAALAQLLRLKAGALDAYLPGAP